MQPDLIFALIILFVSVILHEVAHGYAALWLGDPTAKLAGRLTLNPLPHVDPIGTIVLPLLLILSHSPFFIGYAKPVPVNPYNLPGKYDEAMVAFAGPGTNIIIAVFFGLTIRFAGAALSPALQSAFGAIVFINLLLAIFNLVPLPPLDGSKVLGGLFAALSRRLSRSYELFLINFQRIGILPMILLILLIMNFVLWPVISSLIAPAFSLLTGQSL